MIKILRCFFILIILLPAIMLQGCWLPPRPHLQQPSVLPESPEVIDPPPVDDHPVVNPRPGRFTLRYDPEFTMNPLTALNRDNLMLTSLMYESLFVLDENLNEVLLLCSSWESEDNMVFTIEILPEIAMHDGSYLTADDVAYSLRQAMNHRRSRHRNKLRSIQTVHSDGELTVTITIENPNARFIRLLDIPIIKNGSIDSRVPPGTGPYYFQDPESMRLDRFNNYRYYSDLSLATVYLVECLDSDLTEFFDNGVISLLWDDPTGAFDIRINRMHDSHLYNTTALQYIGFNTNSNALRNNDVRRAIGCAVDRQYIVEHIMTVPRAGQTIAAPVAISPVFNLYDPSWERRGDPLNEMGVLIDRAGLHDSFETGFLALPDGTGGYRPFTLDFIVNIENTHKVAAAHHIAERLRTFGFNVIVRELQWNDFMTALQNGKFDMYYGETQLGADFDFSPLLLPGDDNLNFGNTANNAYRFLIQSFLAASTQEEVSFAGEQLNLAILQSAPFIPVLYKRYAIYSHMGAVNDARPGQSGVFHNFQNWSIDLYSLINQ